MDVFKGVVIETFKHGASYPTFEQKQRFRAITGRSYNRVKRATSVFLVYHERGDAFTAIEWKKCGEVVVSFHGLWQYDKLGQPSESAFQKRQALRELLEQLDSFKIVRVDLAVDAPKIPPRIVKRLSLKRPINPFKSTSYFEPLKQKERENPTLKITLYDKAEQIGLTFPMQRLEFALKARYWPKEPIELSQLQNLICVKSSKVLKQWTGENVEVQKLF